MGVNRVTDRRGRRRVEVRRRWPDGSEFRRYYPNKTVANETFDEIKVAVARGTWPELRDRLCGNKQEEDDLSLREFSEIYLEKYCKVYNKRPDFKVQALSSINRILGDVRLEVFSKDHADRFIAVRLDEDEVEPATVNRGISVMKNMLSFAVDRGYLNSNPLAGFSLLPEEVIPLRIMTLEEERWLVTRVAERSHVIGAYTAILGETGLRKSEGLAMQWEDIDLIRKMLTVPKSKNGEPRYIPLSNYALEWLASLARYQESPWVFMLPYAKPRRLKDPRESFALAKDKAGLDWVKGFHGLRHFRATQWLIHGVDIHTVKHYLGHKRIETTMRYLHFVPSHGEVAVRKAQETEAMELTLVDSGEKVA